MKQVGSLEATKLVPPSPRAKREKNKDWSLSTILITLILAHPIKIFCQGQVQPLLVHVKAIAHAMTVEVKMEDPTGRLIGVGENFVNHLDFGAVEVKSRSVRSVEVLNLSEHAIEFTWAPAKRKSFKIEPETEVVPARGRSKCLVTFAPKKLESSIDLKDRVRKTDKRN